MDDNLSLNKAKKMMLEDNVKKSPETYACIIVDKVYDHCQQRVCFEDISIELPVGADFEFVDILFSPGVIVPGSLFVIPLPLEPNFSRIRFKILIAFIIRVKNLDTGAIIEIPGELPEINKDVKMYVPEARDEFAFEIVIETSSQLLTDPMQDNGSLTFAVGVFIIIKVVGKVQLYIEEFGFCPEPPECEEFIPEDICIDFDEEPFPDFFPEQLENNEE
ncbi:MAG: hypothetical protein ACLKAK_06210 [Alkaliphilus sp.]